MPYFSRLTDIVTCNLTALLDEAADPAAALAEIISEIKEGIAGAERCVATASRNAARIESEIAEQRQSLSAWTDEARNQLAAGEEDRARQSLFRKREVADLISALEEQHRAAGATKDHLTTTLNALQARLVDAQRRLANLHVASRNDQAPSAAAPLPESAPDDSRTREIEAELEELRRTVHGR